MITLLAGSSLLGSQEGQTLPFGRVVGGRQPGSREGQMSTVRGGHLMVTNDHLVVSNERQEVTCSCLHNLGKGKAREILLTSILDILQHRQKGQRRGSPCKG